MKSGILKSLAFFLLIELIFILVGGGISILALKANIIREKIWVGSIGFPIAGLTVLLTVIVFFPPVYQKCKEWLVITKRNLFLFTASYFLTGIIFLLVVLIAQMAGLVTYNDNSEPLKLGMLLTQVLLTFFVGFTEEFIYRGVLPAYFLKKTNKIFTIIIISIFFSIGHLNYFGFFPYLNAFLMGIVSILLLFESGSLYSSIGFHSSWNFFYFFLVSFYNFDVKVIPNWGSLFELFPAGLYLVILIILVLKNNSKPVMV